MISRSLMVAASAVLLSLTGGGCCYLQPYGYPYGGCGLESETWGCASGSCTAEAPCTDCSAGASYGDMAGLVDSCPACGGGLEGCETCGLGVCAGVTLRDCLDSVKHKIHSVLTCGSGCGELYVDEWLSDPPDAHDPCIDCVQESLPPPGCGDYASVPLRLWGRSFRGGDCESCAESTVIEFEDTTPEESSSWPGGRGPLFGGFHRHRHATEVAAHAAGLSSHGQGRTAFPTRARRQLELARYAEESPR